MFCSRTFTLLSRLDWNGALYFAPSQGKTGRYLMEKLFPDHDPNDTIAFVSGNNTYVYSTAIAFILCALPFPLSLLGWLLWLIPRPIRDFAYRIVAANRYSIMGKRESATTCPAPSERLQRHYLP